MKWKRLKEILHLFDSEIKNSWIKPSNCVILVNNNSSNEIHLWTLVCTEDSDTMTLPEAKFIFTENIHSWVSSIASRMAKMLSKAYTDPWINGEIWEAIAKHNLRMFACLYKPFTCWNDHLENYISNECIFNTNYSPDPQLQSGSSRFYLP